MTAAAALGGEAAAARAIELVHREAHLLDTRCWNEWLELYTPDCTFWVPAWRDANVPTNNPDAEISLIYHDSRVALEDRVTRLRSNKTVTAMPLPRTTHLITGAIATAHGADAMDVVANWSVMTYAPRTAAQHVLFGRYEHRLCMRDGEWRIQAKKILLMNDRVPTMLDFYCL